MVTDGPSASPPGSVQVGPPTTAFDASRPHSDLQTDDFAFDLPADLIAQTPLEPRDATRLLVVDKGSGSVTHHSFRDIPALLEAGDVLVVNDSRVLAGRIHAVRATGGRVEFLLLRPRASSSPVVSDGSTSGREWSVWWEALVRPANRIRPGMQLVVAGAEPSDEGPVTVEVGERTASGGVLIRFDSSVDRVLHRFGEMPLPPYIGTHLADATRYQTVYAQETGSAAAPTAGLHFTVALLDAVRDRRVRVVPVTLHVGADTFRPVRADRITDHEMHAEYAIVPGATASAITDARRNGHRVVAVGTTAVRTLETWVRALGGTRANLPEAGWQGWTRIFLYPGVDFQVVDALVTNFHVPRSTLLMLVSAFAGAGVVREAYATAIAARYRFYSFGDACFFR